MDPMSLHPTKSLLPVDTGYLPTNEMSGFQKMQNIIEVEPPIMQMLETKRVEDIVTFISPPCASSTSFAHLPGQFYETKWKTTGQSMKPALPTSPKTRTSSQTLLSDAYILVEESEFAHRHFEQIAEEDDSYPPNNFEDLNENCACILSVPSLSDCEILRTGDTPVAHADKMAPVFLEYAAASLLNKADQKIYTIHETKDNADAGSWKFVPDPKLFS